MKLPSKRLSRNLTSIVGIWKQNVGWENMLKISKYHTHWHLCIQAIPTGAVLTFTNRKSSPDLSCQHRSEGAQPVLSKALRNTLKTITTKLMSHSYIEKLQVLDELLRFFGVFFFLLWNETTVEKYFSDLHFFHNITVIHSHLTINLRVFINNHASRQRWCFVFKEVDRKLNHLHSIPISTRYHIFSISQLYHGWSQDKSPTHQKLVKINLWLVSCFKVISWKEMYM